MKSPLGGVEINPCSRKACQKDFDYYTKDLREKFMVKIIPKICTVKIKKESELRQHIKTIPDLIVF